MVEAEIAPPRLPKPESLEAKYKLLLLLPYDARARRKHCLVFGFIIDWFHSKYGNAFASVRHMVEHIKARDPIGKGLYAGDIHSAVSDLVTWGFLEVEKGAGRRASRYVPKWDLVCSVRETPNTKPDDRSVLESPNAGVLDSPNATGASVRDLPNEDPSTSTRGEDPETRKDDYNDSAAPTVPLADGLASTAAGPAEEFDELYRTYGVRKNKVAAKAEFLKLNLPIADLLAAARIWKAAAGERIDRMYLDRWLRVGKYDEDPPTKYEPKPGKVKLPRKAVGAVRRDADIEEVILENGGFGNIFVQVKWNDATEGEESHHSLQMIGGDYSHLLSDLRVDSPIDLQFKRVFVDFHTAKDGTESIKWHRYPDAANDNLARENDDEEAIRSIPWEEAA